jgi:hypothetical protein
LDKPKDRQRASRQPAAFGQAQGNAQAVVDFRWRNHKIGKWHGHRCPGNDCDDPAYPPEYQAANPFGRDDYDLHRPHEVSARHYSESEDYHWWCWTWWQRYGRAGGFRGNWLKKGSKAGWQYTHNHVLHHRSLVSYGLVDGWLRATLSSSTSVQYFRYDRLDLVREVVGSNPVAPTVSQTQIPLWLRKQLATGLNF